MRFVEFTAIDPESGRKSKININPEHVSFVVSAVVGGGIAGPDGKKIGKTVAALVMGVQTLVVDCTKDEAMQKLTDGNVLNG